MFPVLSTGDIITVACTDELKKRDIILFRDGKNLVCHRIIRILRKPDSTYYITRGDAMIHEDRPVRVDDIIGKVIKIQRKRISLPRRFFLLINPFLRPRLLNALLLSVAVKFL